MSTPKSFQKLINENTSFNHDEFMILISKLSKNLEKAEHRRIDHELTEKVKNQWVLLSKIIDRILLYAFILSTTFILGNIYFILIIFRWFHQYFYF